jgi:hypothetical protein
MVCPSCCLAGRSTLPLEPGDGGHRGMPREHRGKRWSQRSRPSIKLPIGLGSGAGLVGGPLAAGGWACQHRPARSSTPGRGGRTRLRPRELLAARLRAPTLAPLQETHRLRRFLAGSHHTGLATASALTRSLCSRTPTSRKLAASKSSPRASSTGRSSSSVWPPPPERPDGVGELLTVALQPTPLEPVEAGMHLGVAPARIAEAA